MDPVTHALAGMLAGRAVTKRTDAGRTVLWTGVAAGLAPDLDYLLRFVDPLVYLNWHRTFTHSLVLLPAWAGLLALALRRAAPALGGPYRLYALCAAALALHLLLDSITPFGTALLWPLSDTRFSLHSTFVVDPWVTAPLLLGLVLGGAVGRRPAGAAGLAAAGVGGAAGRRPAPAAGLAAAGLVVATEWGLQRQALALARAEARTLGLAPARAHALPQPFSPLRWKLIVEASDGYRVAHVHLRPWRAEAAAADTDGRPESGGGWLAEITAAYDPPHRLRWRTVRHPAAGTAPPLARAAWTRPELEGFRRFARFPFLTDRIDTGDGGPCVWFSDLRFTVPGLTPPFRFGLCREKATETWRLRRTPRHGRVPLTAD